MMKHARAWRRGRSPIGIDLGSRTIKAAQLRATPGGPEIAALAMIPRLDAGREVTRRDMAHLRRVLRRQGFAGSRLVLAVPEEKLLRGHLDLPAGVQGAPVAQMARMELARLHHIEPQAFEMVHWGMEADTEKTGPRQLVAVACPHRAAEQLLDAVEIGGLEVMALDARSAAAARACRPLTLPAPALTAVLDLGWSSSKLLLVSGATVVYERLLTSELAKLTSTLTRRFGLEDRAASQIIDTVGLTPTPDVGDLDPASVEAISRLVAGHIGQLIDELHTPFSYAAHQYGQSGIQRLLLLGGGGRIPGLAAYLAERLRLEALRAAPCDLSAGGVVSLGKADNPAATVAVGLALFEEGIR